MKDSLLEGRLTRFWKKKLVMTAIQFSNNKINKKRNKNRRKEYNFIWENFFL